MTWVGSVILTSNESGVWFVIRVLVDLATLVMALYKLQMINIMRSKKICHECSTVLIVCV